MDIQVEELNHLIKISKHIVFFGGAGVSTESGLKDFRSKDGLYNLRSKYGRPYEEMLSHHYFWEDTKTFYEFYKEFMIVKGVKPNPAHKYLAELEKKKDITIITQNIDGLHQLAGSKNVLELHGSIHRNYCTKCHKFFNLEYIEKSKGVPTCDSCGGLIKPDVVLYEEGLDNDVLEASVNALNKADLLIIAGTSLRVYPASGLINYYRGSKIVVINKEKLDIRYKDVLEINSPVGEVFSQLDI